MFQLAKSGGNSKLSFEIFGGSSPFLFFHPHFFHISLFLGCFSAGLSAGLFLRPTGAKSERCWRTFCPTTTPLALKTPKALWFYWISFSAFLRLLPAPGLSSPWADVFAASWPKIFASRCPYLRSPAFKSIHNWILKSAS